jgi:hypothetical protein
MQVVEITDVWVKDPRWSWYRTPLWKCAAVRLEIRSYEPVSMSTAMPLGGGSLNALPPIKPIQYTWVYFTNEEYVMFKLEHYAEGYEYDMIMLKNGIVYK